MTEFSSVDDPRRGVEISASLQQKTVLRRIYEDTYRRFAALLRRCPEAGIALELGSGGGFAKAMVPELVTSDILPYPGLDAVVDATRMPFADHSLRAIVALNVFHHIPDVEAFLREAVRCLMPGGRLLLTDQHLGLISTPILKYVHNEPCRPKAATWSFASTGPLSGANGALAWIVFRRDLALFSQRFPKLKLISYEPHTPLLYWLSGGLSHPTLLPTFLLPLALWVDAMLVKLSPQFGSFVDIEVLRLPDN